MRVLITGGAGFIGSNLADYLLKEGHEVLSIDNFSNGRRENLKEADKYNNFTFTAVDILDTEWLNILLSDFEPEAIFHLAARGSVPASIKDPTATFTNNTLGTHGLMLMALKHKVERFIYASSSSVYGDSVVEFKREDQPLYPTNPYGISKYVTELYGMNFNRLYDLPCAAVRFFNVYGPRQRHDIKNAAVVPTFIKKSLAKENISIHGDGHSRDFTFIHDVTRALSMFLRVDPHSWAGQSYNVCTGKETSIAELSNIIESLVSSDVTVSYAPTREGDIKRSVGCNKKLLKDLYWGPSTNIKSGLIETIESYRN